MNAATNDRVQDESLLNDLAHDFTQRLRQGERPSVEPYVQRYPHLAADIRDIFSMLMLIELPDGGPSAMSPDGRPSLNLEGNRLGEYQIIRQVGRGGMGVVYEAIQEKLGRRVALKVLPARNITDVQQLERFQREARATANLHHTNIVSVYEVGQTDGLHFYSMQFIDGPPLSALLDDSRRSAHPDQPSVTLTRAARRKMVTCSADSRILRKITSRWARARPKDQHGSWPVREVARIGKQVASALAHAHGQGVLHRDIKPGNLLMDARGTVWVTDFGLARVEGLDDLTSPTDVVGTLRYLPPERFEGQVDERGDIYSLGITLYEMLTGRPAFAASTRARLIDLILHAIPTAPHRIDGRIPRELETIVLKAMSREPSQRYANADALADDLDRFIAGRPILARRLSTWGHAWSWCRRNRALAAMTALAISLLFGISLVSTFASIQLKRQLDATRLAQRESRERRVDTLIAHSRATRLTGRVGQRVQAVKALREATDIARELSLPQRTFNQLRNELIAASCLTDLEQAGDPIRLPPGAVIDVDPQFERFAIGHLDGSVTVHRLEDRKQLARLPGVGIPVADYGGVVFSPNGQYLQQLCYTKDGSRRLLRLWKLTRQPRLVIDIPDALWAAFRPDSQQIAIKIPEDAAETAIYQFPRAASIHVHETSTGREVSAPFRSKEVASFTFHPRLRRLAVSDSRWMHIIDLETLEELDRWETAGNLFPLWDAEGRILVTTNDDHLLIYRRDTFRNENLTPLAGHKSKGIIYTFSHSGDTLVSNDWSGIVRFWDVRAGRFLLDFPAGGFSTGMRFSADDQRVSGVAGKGVSKLIRFWPGRELRQFVTRAHRKA